MSPPLVSLEVFHRTDFTVDELVADASDLENAQYWLLTNQDLQPQILNAVESAREAFAAIPEGQTPGQNRAYQEAAGDVQGLLDQLYNLCGEKPQG